MREHERFPERSPQESRREMTPYGIWGKLEQMHREMNRLFEETILPFREGGLFAPITFTPNVKEEGENIIVTLELPEIDARNIEIDAAENYVTIKAEQREEHGGEKEDYRFQERHYGLIQSTIPLPKKVRPEAAEAKYEHKTLQIVLPKKEEKQTDTIRLNVKRSPH
jgi:HSP20 family protein